MLQMIIVTNHCHPDGFGSEKPVLSMCTDHGQSMSSRLVLGHKSPESPAGKCLTYTILCPDLDYPKTLKELSAQKRLYVVNSAVHWWRHQWVRRKPFFAPCGHLVG